MIKEKNAIKVRGFFRLKVVENEDDGKTKIVGDSGWRENTVVNDGFDQFIVRSLGSISGSKYITHAALGTGTAPGATDTSLNGEITDASNCRCAVTPTTVASKTLQLAFTLDSNIITAAKTIQNVGLFASSQTGAGTIFAGQTYTTSALATNQAVNGTYQIRFS
jgi:hypothetical protein